MTDRCVTVLYRVLVLLVCSDLSACCQIVGECV